LGPWNLKWVMWPRSHPSQRWFVIRSLGLAKINLLIKFELTSSISYEDRKDDARYGKRGGLGYLGSLRVIRNSIIR